MYQVTIPQTEYTHLLKQVTAYRKLVGDLFGSVIHGSVEDVVMDFRKTNLYTDEFLVDLESGLKKSSLGKLTRRKRVR